MAVSDVISRRAVLQAVAEAEALGRDRFLAKYGFSYSSEYVLEYSGREFDSKAIMSAAHGFAFPAEGPLKPPGIRGGKGRGQAGYQLDKLGFAVRGIRKNPVDWSVGEVEHTVADYFEMLRAELAGEPYNKSAHNMALRAHLNGRLKAAVEFKHTNISAVLRELRMPYIRGYKAARDNYQILLQAVVVDAIAERPEIFDVTPKLAIRPSAIPAFVPPPRPTSQGENAVRLRRAVKIDFAARDAANRSLGAAGEEWIVERERERLSQSGLSALAAKIRHVSKSDGDGLGYDIQSFRGDGSPLYIEAKTTRRPADAPFFVTETEVAASSDLRSAFALYRVFNFGSATQAFILPGPIKASCTLSPKVWRAIPTGTSET